MVVGMEAFPRHFISRAAKTNKSSGIYARLYQLVYGAKVEFFDDIAAWINFKPTSATRVIERLPLSAGRVNSGWLVTILTITT